MSDVRVIGVDVGGTKCAVCLGTAGGHVLDSIRFPTAGQGFEATMPRLVDSVGELLSRSDGPPPSALGVSCGGPLDSRKGIILNPPNLPGWEDAAIVERLQKELSLPCFLENDANACALAEWRLGAGRGSRNMVFCTMGTGFGAGLIIDGRLYRGANDGAGEIGHVRLTAEGPVGYGKPGSVEGYCGGGGIADLARMRVEHWLATGQEVSFCPSSECLTQIDAKVVGDAAEKRDRHALAIYQEVGTMLGRTLAILVDVLNPEVIVVGSIFARSEQVLRAAMEEALEAEAIPRLRAVCRVVPSALGEELGNQASLMVALEGLGGQGEEPGPGGAGSEGVLVDLLRRYPVLVPCENDIRDAFHVLRDCYRHDGKLLVCGNGGSAADAEHIVGELMKGFLKPRPVEDGAIDPSLSEHLQGALSAVALTGHPSLATAFANDVEADMVFAQQVYGLGRKGDVVLGISTSGDSPNVVNAVKVASARGLRTIVLTGRSGGALRDLSEIAIRVPSAMVVPIQELHLPVYHALCAMLEEEFFGA